MALRSIWDRYAPEEPITAPAMISGQETRRGPTRIAFTGPPGLLFLDIPYATSGAARVRPNAAAGGGHVFSLFRTLSGLAAAGGKR